MSRHSQENARNYSGKEKEDGSVRSGPEGNTTYPELMLAGPLAGLVVVYFVIVKLIVVENILVWPQLEFQTATKAHWYTTVSTVSELYATLKWQPERNMR